MILMTSSESKLRKQLANGIVLGRQYADTVLGFQGIATACTTYLTGCDRVTLSRPDKDGEKTLEHYCDYTVLERADLFHYNESVQSRVDEDPGGPGEPVPKSI